MNYPYYNSYFQPQRQELIKVNGIEGAKNYPLSPGSTVALFDAESDIMYIKTMDAGGFPSIRTFSFIEMTSKPTDTTETRLSAIEEEISRFRFRRRDSGTTVSLSTGIMRKRITILRIDGENETGTICTVIKRCTTPYIRIADKLACIIHKINANI